MALSHAKVYTNHMENNNALKLIYTFILGIVLAIFIGVGVHTFYEAPEYPEVPVSYGVISEEGIPSKEQVQYDRDYELFSEENQVYQRNASIILLSLSVVLVALGLVFAKRLGFLADGVLLGGMLSLLHALIRGLEADDSKYLFVAVSVSVVVVMLLGYWRFARIQKPAKKPKKS